MQCLAMGLDFNQTEAKITHTEDKLIWILNEAEAIICKVHSGMKYYAVLENLDSCHSVMRKPSGSFEHQFQS